MAVMPLISPELFLEKILTHSQLNRTRFSNVASVLKWNAEHHTTLWPLSEHHPLHYTSQPPPYLFVRGSLSALNQKAIAIVGTRNATSKGRAAAFHFARELGRQGFAIISGLARGIDRFAHEGALKAGAPTIAVLAHGLDRIYPPEHAFLAESLIKEGGCLVSEYAPSVPPLKHQFPQRNRLIAGLSLATLVIEAPLKSGALITADFAGDCGRDVFVLAGPHDSNFHAGNHALIRDGAELVTHPIQILESLGVHSKTLPELSSSPFLDFFGEETKTLNELIMLAGDERARFLEWLESAVNTGVIVETHYQQYAKVSVESRDV